MRQFRFQHAYLTALTPWRQLAEHQLLGLGRHVARHRGAASGHGIGARHPGTASGHGIGATASAVAPMWLRCKLPRADGALDQ
jgi:hypothetical protein